MRPCPAHRPKPTWFDWAFLVASIVAIVLLVNLLVNGGPLIQTSR